MERVIGFADRARRAAAEAPPFQHLGFDPDQRLVGGKLRAESLKRLVKQAAGLERAAKAHRQRGQRIQHICVGGRAHGLRAQQLHALAVQHGRLVVALRAGQQLGFLLEVCRYVPHPPGVRGRCLCQHAVDRLCLAVGKQCVIGPALRRKQRGHVGMGHGQVAARVKVIGVTLCQPLQYLHACPVGRNSLIRLFLLRENRPDGPLVAGGKTLPFWLRRLACRQRKVGVELRAVGAQRVIQLAQLQPHVAQQLMRRGNLILHVNIARLAQRQRGQRVTRGYEPGSGSFGQFF